MKRPQNDGVHVHSTRARLRQNEVRLCEISKKMEFLELPFQPSGGIADGGELRILSPKFTKPSSTVLKLDQEQSRVTPSTQFNAHTRDPLTSRVVAYCPERMDWGGIQF